MPLPMLLRSKAVSSLPFFIPDDVGKILIWFDGSAYTRSLVIGFNSSTEVQLEPIGRAIYAWPATTQGGMEAGASRRFIERFSSRVVADIRDAFFVDCGVSFDNRNTSATTITLSGGVLYNSTELITLTASAATFRYPATTDVGNQIVYTDALGVPFQVTIESTSSTTVAQGRPVSTIPASFRAATTLWAWALRTFSVPHLDGKEVAILADGFKAPRQVVTISMVTLAVPAVRVQIGLPYSSDAETLALAPATPETVRGNFKLVTTLRPVLQETQSLWAGPTPTQLVEAKTQKNVAGGYMTPPSLISGVVTIPLESTWDRNGTTLIRNYDPTPIGILALMPEVTIGGV